MSDAIAGLDGGPGNLSQVDAGDVPGDDDPVDLGSRDAVELTTGSGSPEIDTGAAADGRYPDDEP